MGYWLRIFVVYIRDLYENQFYKGKEKYTVLKQD